VKSGIYKVVFIPIGLRNQKWGIYPIPAAVVFIPIRLRNQIWDKYHFSGTQLWQRRAKGREFIMPPRRTDWVA